MSSMANSTLSKSDVQEICIALSGLKGAKAKAEAMAQAQFRRVSYSRICEVSKLVRPARKKRSDKGKRKYHLLENEALRFAAELVANQNLSPELALETMNANKDKFGSVDIKLGTFRRYLNQHGISRTQAKKNRMTYRPFEADFPGQIFQMDFSCVKERWIDIKTRAAHKVSALEVSRNHPNRRNDRVPLWKFTIKDDKSRKKFVRFVACTKPNTIYVVDFLKEAFQALGVPYVIYTDNDVTIVNKRMERGAKFINETFKDCGGFEMKQHAPGNPQATGKVERSHQVVEEYEKLIGVSSEYGSKPNLDGLNKFADWLCDRYNNKPCRATGVAPNIVFRATTNPKRMVDPAQLDAAFKARDLNLKVTPDVCIVVDTVKYQLSRRDSEPFLHLAETGQRLDVFWLDDEDYFACITPAGDEFIVDKVIAKADSAFDYKTLPETTSEKTRRSLKASQKERIKAVKIEQKEQEEPVIIVPGIHTEIPAHQPGVIEFPQRVETGDVETLHTLTHQVANTETEYSHPVDLFDALEILQEKEIAPAKPGDKLTEIKHWLRLVFEGREFITETELNEALNSRDFLTENEALEAVNYVTSNNKLRIA